MAFVHLHVHSQLSLLDGTLTPKALAEHARSLGMSAVALTDTCNLFGAVIFQKACEDKAIQPIFGAELFVAAEGTGTQAGYQVIALVEDAQGYANLSKLITLAIFEGMDQRPRLQLAQIRDHASGLVWLSGGQKGLVGQTLRDSGAEAAQQACERFVQAVGRERFYLELVSLGLEREQATLQQTRAIAQRMGLACVVTNAVHYKDPEDAVAHDVLTAISRGAQLTDPLRPRAKTDQAWFKSEAQMREVWGDDPALETSVEIAARCTFRLTLNQFHFPSTTPPHPGQDTPENWEFFFQAFPPPRGWGFGDVREAVQHYRPGLGALNAYFRWYAETGLERRIATFAPESQHIYRERLEEEIQIITQMEFPAYFLIVAEFINWSKDEGIPVGPGRGSAAGSVVAWGMGITDIDPVRFDLLFERFLNPERKSMPDIDVDFCQDRRGESIEHVRTKYGEALVGQILTQGTLKAKAGVRDMARVLGWDPRDADRLAKMIPDEPDTTFKKIFDTPDSPDVVELVELYRRDPQVTRLIDLAQAVEGFPKSLGIHAAGVVIGDRPLVDYVPLYRDGEAGTSVVQFDMKSVESAGLIKFDFLGLKTLDEIRDAIAMVEEIDGVKIDPGEIPLDDPATFASICQGDLLGVFQFEGEGIRRMVVELQPSNIDDLAAATALYRPGPLNSGMVSDFISRKHGKQEVSYLHPALEPVLKNTYGTVIYQEQVMQVARVLSGYSLGEADLLRRAMGKKKPEEMAKQKTRFMTGATDQGVDEGLADSIFDLLAKFAEYGFNKSHSAAYGVVAYQTAWLKTHHRAEFMAAVMTVESGNQKGRDEKLGPYIEDCRSKGLKVVAPCVNRGVGAFRVEKDDQGRKQIRYGMAIVKGVGDGVIQCLVAEREKGGLYQSPIDLLKRDRTGQLNKRVMEALIKAGALDCFGVERSVLLASLSKMMDEGRRLREDAASGQASLFGMQKKQTAVAFRYTEAAPWTALEKLSFEHDVLGVHLSAKPLAAYGGDIERFGNTTIEALESASLDAEVRVVGWPAACVERTTKRGTKMATLTLEGTQSSIKVMFFEAALDRSRHALKATDALVVRGRLQRRNGEFELIADSAESIADVRSRHCKACVIALSEADLEIPKLKRLQEFVHHPSGKLVVQLEVRLVDQSVYRWQIKDSRVIPNPTFEREITQIFQREGIVQWL